MSTASTLLNSTMPRDLRGGGPADAGAGKTYDVDPTAVERLKAHIAAKQAAPPVASPTAVPTVRRKEPEPAEAAPALPEPTDPATLYPTAVIEAAKEQEQANGRRNLAKVLTDDVLAIWDRWNNDGMSMNAISQKTNNGLIELAQSEVGRYLRRYRERLEEGAMGSLPQPETAVTPPAPPPTPKAQRGTSPGRKAVVVKQAVIAEPETAVIEPVAAADVRAQTPAPEPAAPVTAPVTVEAETPLPKPEIEPLETAVAPFAPQRPENLPPWLDRQWAPPPAPRPGDALAALASLVNNEQLRIKGSVKLNLEIEFGD